MGNIHFIALTRERVACVDEEDYERVSKHSWHSRQAKDKHGTRYYAGTAIWSPITKKLQYVQLHRFVMDEYDPNVFIDHMDHNGENCLKQNLRVCTNGQNVQNQRVRNHTACKMKGVKPVTGCDTFQVSIRIDGKYTYMGLTKTIAEGGHIYDFWAAYFYKEFAWFNFPTKKFETNLNAL